MEFGIPNSIFDTDRKGLKDNPLIIWNWKIPNSILHYLEFGIPFFLSRLHDPIH